MKHYETAYKLLFDGQCSQMHPVADGCKETLLSRVQKVQQQGRLQINNIQFLTFHVQHSRFNISCSTFHVQHFMFNISCSTFHLKYSKDNRIDVYNFNVYMTWICSFALKSIIQRKAKTSLAILSEGLAK